MRSHRQQTDSGPTAGVPAVGVRSRLPGDHLRRLAALGEMELAAGDLTSVLDRIAAAVADLLPASAGAAIVLLGRGGGEFVRAASSDPREDEAAVLRRLASSGGTVRWVADRGEPVLVTARSRAPGEPKAPALPGTCEAYAAVPIAAGASTLGVLVAGSVEPRPWTDGDRAMLATMARRAAVAILNARLMAETRAAHDRAVALHGVGQALIGVTSPDGVARVAVDGAIRLSGADHARLTVLDPATETVVVHHAGDQGSPPAAAVTYEEIMSGVTGLVMGTGETVLEAKTGDGRGASSAPGRVAGAGGSAVSVPVRIPGGLVGTLSAARLPGREAFTADEALRLEGLAGLAAVAVERIRLAESNEAANARVRALYKVMEAVNSELGLDELLARLADVVADALPAHRVAITLCDVGGRRVNRVVAGGSGRDRVDTVVAFDELWDGLGGWVLRNRRPAIGAAPGSDPRESEEAATRRARAGTGPTLVVPLFHRGRLLGTMTASNAVDGVAFGPDDVATVSTMAGHVAVAVANAELVAELQMLAITDELTGAHNRRHLFDLAERDLAAARRSGARLGVVMFDIDRFKEVNDRHGHHVGDQVLAEVVRRCSREIRDIDVLGRYGGEEFAVVLPGADGEGARRTAERLRRSVGDDPIDTKAGPLPITISAGVAVVSPGTASVDDLMDRADAAMLAAKQRGRDQVVVG